MAKEKTEPKTEEEVVKIFNSGDVRNGIQSSK